MESNSNSRLASRTGNRTRSSVSSSRFRPHGSSPGPLVSRWVHHHDGSRARSKKRTDIDGSRLPASVMSAVQAVALAVEVCDSRTLSTWMTWSRGTPAVFALDLDSVHEGGAGADQGDQVG